MKFNEIFDELMTSRSLSNYQLSKDTGISDSLIGYWRNGKRKPSLENLRILSKYFNTTVDFLITGEESSKHIRDTKPSLSDDETALLKYFNCLDSTGKTELLEYAQFKMFQSLKKSDSSMVNEKDNDKIQGKYIPLNPENSNNIIA